MGGLFSKYVVVHTPTYGASLQDNGDRSNEDLVAWGPHVCVCVHFQIESIPTCLFTGALYSLLMLTMLSSTSSASLSFSSSLSFFPSVLSGCHYAMCEAHARSLIRCEWANLLQTLWGSGPQWLIRARQCQKLQHARPQCRYHCYKIYFTYCL